MASDDHDPGCPRRRPAPGSREPCTCAHRQIQDAPTSKQFPVQGGHFPAYTGDWKDSFCCPHCRERYGHENATWDHFGFTGVDALREADCRKCGKRFSAELSVVCIYRALPLATPARKPALRVLKGGKATGKHPRQGQKPGK